MTPSSIGLGSKFRSQSGRNKRMYRKLGEITQSALGHILVLRYGCERPSAENIGGLIFSRKIDSRYKETLVKTPILNVYFVNRARYHAEPAQLQYTLRPNEHARTRADLRLQRIPQKNQKHGVTVVTITKLVYCPLIRKGRCAEGDYQEKLQ